MTLDEAKVLWQAQQAAGPSPLSNDAVMAFVQTRSAAFDAMIRQRDRRETVAAIGVALFFGLIGLILTVLQLYLASLGAVCVVLASGWIYWKLNTTRIRHDTDAGDAPLGQTLRRELDKVNVQIHLLRTVFWWYILPLVTGGLLFVLGLPGVYDRPLPLIVIAAILSLAIYRINQQAVKTELLPLRREFTELLSDLLDHKE